MQKTLAHRKLRSSGSLAEARRGICRATLLFGSIAAALALIVVPAIDRRAPTVGVDGSAGLDATITGSITPASGAQRTIFDRPETGPCIMFPDGSQKGACR